MTTNTATTTGRRGEHLATLLPAAVMARIDSEWELLTERPSAAALRVLASIRNDGWHEFIRPMTVNWPDMLAWARNEFGVGDTVRIRVEVAASLAGHYDARPNLLLAMVRLDEPNRAAFAEALRILDYDSDVTW